jgi:hypothetical protein
MWFIDPREQQVLMQVFIRRLLMCVSCVMLVSCGPSWEAEAGGVGKGYDVYRPEPYLMVTRVSEVQRAAQPGQATTQPVSQQYTAKIIWLPDYSTRYRIRSVQGGASIWIKDGWELSSLSDQNSTTAVLSALAGAGSQAGQAGGDVLSVLSILGGQPISAQGSAYPTTRPAGDDRLPGSQGVALYKIIYNQEGRVSGLVKIEPTQDASQLRARLADHAPPPVPQVSQSH